jgi:hypothetical protein
MPANVDLIYRRHVCGERRSSVIQVLTVFFSGCFAAPCWREIAEIDRSIAIVAEAAQNLNRASFPLKSKAKNFDGLAVGFRPSEEIFCA